MCYVLIKYFVIFLYFLSNFIIFSSAKHSKYKIYNIEESDLCSPIKTNTIKLDSKYAEAILITQFTTKNHKVNWAKNYDCNFTIKSDSGIFAAVQNINFRKNTTTNKCIDYIKFNTRKLQFHEEICGDFNVYNNIDNNFYFTTDVYGYIETRVFISKEKLSPDFKMDLKIVFTRYKSCDQIYNSCDGVNKALCIHKQLFNDSYVNCPINNCFDETNCEVLRTKKQNQEQCGLENCDFVENNVNSTKIILSAVTSLVISFVVFIVCIWICKKTGKLCWGANCRETTDRQPSRVIEMQNRTEINQTEVPISPDPEKDLPPSYDSLFPSR